MSEIIRRCQLTGYRSIVVWVLESNARARKFYEAGIVSFCPLEKCGATSGGDFVFFEERIKTVRSSN